MVPDHLDGANLTQGTAKFSPGREVVARYIQFVLGSVGANSEFERIAKGATFKEITLDNSQKVRDGLKEILLGPGQLYEALRS